MKKIILLGLILGMFVGTNSALAVVPAYNPDYNYGAPPPKPQYQTAQPQYPYPQQPYSYSSSPQVPMVFRGIGPYVGIQGGFSEVSGPQSYYDYYDYDYFWLWNYGSSVESALAWRTFAGFNILRFLAVEGGFSQNGSISIPCSDFSYCKVSGIQAWDIMGKLVLPIKTYNPDIGVEFYIKGGAAYVSAKVDMDSSYYYQDEKYTNSGWVPAYGMGVTFVFQKYVGLDLSWYGYAGKDGWVDYSGVHGDYLPAMNMFTVGLIFKLPLTQ